ncbi:hypothetical protein EI94DRAFT_537662 [Lactarius quietus]|nr:hypothetical protein EI94DRAFT_537662 [Lactarius quietus]
MCGANWPSERLRFPHSGMTHQAIHSHHLLLDLPNYLLNPRRSHREIDRPEIFGGPNCQESWNPVVLANRPGWGLGATVGWNGYARLFNFPDGQVQNSTVGAVPHAFTIGNRAHGLFSCGCVTEDL